MRRLVLVAALLFAAGCSSQDDEPMTDALDQMVISSDGSHSRPEIRTAVDAALRATGETISEDTYSRAGSVLVTFRREHGIPEMRILACIPEVGNATGGRMSFPPEAAALCVTELSTTP